MAAERVSGSVSSRAPCQIGRTRPPTILIVAPPFGVDRPHLAIEDLDDALRGWPPEQHVRRVVDAAAVARSEEHTSELQSLMRISSAFFFFKKKHDTINTNTTMSNIITHP